MEQMVSDIQGLFLWECACACVCMYVRMCVCVCVCVLCIERNPISKWMKNKLISFSASHTQTYGASHWITHTNKDRDTSFSPKKKPCSLVNAIVRPPTTPAPPSCFSFVPSLLPLDHMVSLLSKEHLFHYYCHEKREIVLEDINFKNKKDRRIDTER